MSVVPPADSGGERLLEGQEGTSPVPAQEISLLADLAAADRARILAFARRVEAAAGDLVMEEGTPGDGLYIILSGQLEVTRKEGEQDVVLAVHGPGAFVGEMSLVEDAPRSASVRAVTESELLVIPPIEFRYLLQCSSTATLTILRTVLGRLRSTEASLLQHAKLASLGTLAAGLAHELNNPTSAIRRGVSTLGDALTAAEAASRRLSDADPTAVAARPVNPVLKPPPSARDPIAQAEWEDDMAEWLETKGVERGYELAPPLLACGWNPESLGRLTADHEGAVSPLLEWLAWTCTSRIILEEIGRAAEAVFQMVQAVRTYAFLDQAEVQDVDIVETIENTLLILRHRLKDGVHVHRRYSDDLPRLPALGSELSQLWTNLIDNAVDAMSGEGELKIVVERDGDCIAIHIIDSGPGIEGAVLPRIFDPFFTTKGQGEGSGIGLHVAYGIVRRHRGRISVSSRPGRTAFTVLLPVQGIGSTVDLGTGAARPS